MGGRSLALSWPGPDVGFALVCRADPDLRPRGEYPAVFSPKVHGAGRLAGGRGEHLVSPAADRERAAAAQERSRKR